jgi:hypothetical protein
MKELGLETVKEQMILVQKIAKESK